MQDHRKITIGDEIELHMDDGTIRRTLISEVSDDGLFLVALPDSDDKPLLLNANDELMITYYRVTGMYMIRMSVLSVLCNGGCKQAWLKPLAQIEKIQRREHFRVSAKLKASMCHLPQPESSEPEFIETVETADISVSGVAILSKRAYRIGERYIIKLNLYGSVRPLIIETEIRRTQPWRESDYHIIGMRFLDVTDSMNDALGRFVTTRQNSIIANRRLVERNGS